MVKNPSIIGKSTAPTMMKRVPEFGGLTRLEAVPSGGVSSGVSANIEAGTFSRYDMLE